ncbi:MAG TPA: hypothetical protein VI197_04785 [Polyangiaceae bacterium]
MIWHEYLDAADIHLFDCSGKVDLATGLARLTAVARVFETQPARAGLRRLLIDFRGTEWDSEETHRTLSSATRAQFDRMRESARLRVAIVNALWEGCHSTDERWFLEKQAALRWLSAEDGHAA